MQFAAPREAGLFFGLRQGCLNPVLKGRNPAGFSVLRSPQDLGFDIPGLRANKIKKTRTAGIDYPFLLLNAALTPSCCLVLQSLCRYQCTLFPHVDSENRKVSFKY